MKNYPINNICQKAAQCGFTETLFERMTGRPLFPRLPILLDGHPDFVSVADMWQPVTDEWHNHAQKALSALRANCSCDPERHPDRVLLEHGNHFGRWQYRYCVRRGMVS
jgi:hypothetical protein